MTFPFMTTGFTGWRPSFINFQMCSTNPMNSMNILWNQLNMKSIASSMVYNYPVFSMDNYTPFFNGTNNDYLLNPNLAAMQTLWNNNSNGNIWGNYTNINPFGNFDFGKMWGGLRSSGNSSGVVGDERTKTSEQIKYNKKYNKLLSLMKQLKNSDKLSESEKENIEAAIIADNENPNGEWKDKFNALKKVYDKIDDTHIKNYIINSMDDSVNGKTGVENSFKVQLTDAGYEYKKEDVDKKIRILADNIKDLTNDNPSIAADNLIAGIEAGSVSILDVISSWNTNYADSTDNDKKRLIKYVVAKYNDLDDNGKSEIKSQLLDPLARALEDKAETLETELENKGIDAANLTKALKALEAVREAESLDTDDLVEAFDDLYLATRWAAIKVITKDAEEYYGSIDSMFDNDLFDTDTVNDLKSEGFTDAEINAQKVDYTSIEHDDNDDNDDGDNDDDYGDTPEAQIEYLKEEAFVETLQSKTYINDETIYRETTPTGKNGEARLFISKDGKLCELINPELDANGKYKAEALQVVSAEQIIEYQEAKLAAEEEAKRNAEEEAAGNKEDIRTDGGNVTRKLCGWTSKKDTKQINEILQKINKDNVLAFLEGAFAQTSLNENSTKHKDRYNIEGIIEKMTDDNAGDNITTENVAKLVRAFLDKAAAMGLQETEEYKTINKYLVGIEKGTQDFNTKVIRETIRDINQYYVSRNMDKAIDIWFLSGNYTISEVIDDMIRLLYPKMKD